jgi:hypothetical protein
MNIKTLSFAGIATLCAAITLLAVDATAQAGLPDNRVYEMVSPTEKGGDSHMPNLAVASADGEHVVVDGGVANSPLSSGASWMIETRTPTGWSGTQVGPPPGTQENYIEQRSTALAAISENFSSFAFQTLIGVDPRDQNSLPGVSFKFGPLTIENVPSSDAYVRNGPTGPLVWASGPPAPTVKNTVFPVSCETEPTYCGTNNAMFGGASSDLSVVAWSQRSPLVEPPAALPGSPADTHEYGSEVYESVNGADQALLGLVPASGAECGPGHGSCMVPPCGAALGNAPGNKNVRVHSFAPTEGDVSGDGSQVVFISPEPAVEGTEGCPTGSIYLREGGTSTVQVSASQRAGGDPHGPRPKLYAGSVQENGHINTVFFTSKEELTDNANTGSDDEGSDLYAYNVESGKLTDITPDGNPADANGADVVAFVGSSTDGSVVYFTATGVLTAEPNSEGKTAQSGEENLYVHDARTGTTRFIAPGSGVAGPEPVSAREFAETRRLTAQVTPDGQHLVFTSNERITTYDNAGSTCGQNGEPGPCAEVYLYSEPENRLVCVSCDPSGVLPSGSAGLPEESHEAFSDELEAPGTLARPRVVSAGGERVFFDSPDQLTLEAPAPSPTRAEYVLTEESLEPNVYEYEDGRIYLIAAHAALSTTTPSGNDVFFDTISQLVSQDRDGSPDIYDARVDGGFPALAAPECSGTACQGLPAAAPVFATPPSVTFAGVGNLLPSSPTSSSVKAKKAKKARKRSVGKGSRSKTHRRGKRSTGHSKGGDR